MQLSALAFPSEPLSLARVPDLPTMEQEKSVPVRRRAIQLVQPPDSRDRSAQELIVVRSILGHTVRPVREQCKTEIAIRSREVMNRQAFDLLFEFRWRRQKGGYDDQGAQTRRHPIPKLQTRQDLR